MISSPVIKAFYDGIGVARDAKHGVRGMQKQSVCYVSQEFYLPHNSKRLEQIEHATIDRFVFLSNKWGNDVNHLDSFTFVPTDKDGNHDPFEIVKGQDIYRHENGNALRLIFDEPALPVQQDVAPAEKPLNQREKNTMLNIIHGLLEIAKKDTGKSQAEIINELENYGYRGLKKSTLEKYFSEANKIHQRG